MAGSIRLLVLFALVLCFQVVASDQEPSLSLCDSIEIPEQEYSRPAAPFLTFEGDGSGCLQHWSPNQFRFTASVPHGPTIVIVNLPFDKSWQSNAGTITNQNGQLAVVLDSGDHRVTLQYQRGWFVFAVWIASVSLAVALTAWVWKRKGTKSYSA